jgi:hypothetical protein
MEKNSSLSRIYITVETYFQTMDCRHLMTEKNVPVELISAHFSSVTLHDRGPKEMS